MANEQREQEQTMEPAPLCCQICGCKPSAEEEQMARLCAECRAEEESCGCSDE